MSASPKDVLVETDWLAQHAQDPNVRVFEVDVDTAAYDQGHVAGAAGLNWKSDLQQHPVRDLLDKKQLEALLSKTGATPDTTIVSGNAKIIDVRSPKEYAGELLAPENLPQEGAQRGGHIPGAQNVPWATAVAEDGRFKSAEELRQIYGTKGIDGKGETIAYCRIGERSAHTWFVLKYLLGQERVRNYDGSWTEWGSLIGVPIEKSTT